MIFVFLALALYFGFILTVIGLYSPFVVILSLVLFLVASFVSLKVMIDGTHLRIKFGYGIFSKRFVLRDIISAKTVKNHWYYGWGIRYWPWSHMWIFNISGFDAVEIKMKNGKTYRIGTDEPEKLEHSIMQVIKR